MNSVSHVYVLWPYKTPDAMPEKSAILVWSFFLGYFFLQEFFIDKLPLQILSGCYQIWNMHTKWKQFLRRSRGCVPCMLNSSSLKLQAPLTAPFQPPRCPPTIKALIPLYQIINGREMQITFPALLTFFFFFLMKRVFYGMLHWCSVAMVKPLLPPKHTTQLTCCVKKMIS